MQEKEASLQNYSSLPCAFQLCICNTGIPKCFLVSQSSKSKNASLIIFCVFFTTHVFSSCCWNKAFSNAIQFTKHTPFPHFLSPSYVGLKLRYYIERMASCWQHSILLCTYTALRRIFYEAYAVQGTLCDSTTQKIQVQISILFLQHGVRISTFLFPCFFTVQVLMYDT